MTERHDDDRLHEAFAALRREDARTTPPFVAPRMQPRPWPLRRPLAAAATVAAALAIVVAGWLTLRDTLPSHVGPIDLASTTWVAPTDFLLRTPGAERLRGVPALGVPAPHPAALPTTSDNFDSTKRNGS